VYLDPSEGRAGTVLDTLYGAATSGALKVDPHTGETTLRFLNQVQDLAEALARKTREAGIHTPLGGGFGREVGAFNQRLATGEPGSADDMLARFRADLERLKDAVARSIESYRSAEAGNARTIADAGVRR
jgi:hypothetical protein